METGGGEFATPGRGSVPFGTGSAAQEYAFLVGRLIDAETLQSATAAAAQSGSTPLQEMLARGWLSPGDYVHALSEQLKPAGPDTVVRGTVAIDATAAGPGETAAQAQMAAAIGLAPLLVAGADMAWLETDETRRARAAEATDRLQRIRPDLSARSAHANWQLLLAPAAIGLACGGAIVAPETAIPLLAGLVTFPFLAVVGLRIIVLVLLFAGIFARPHRRRQRRLADTALPVYSILVPLYQEAEVLPDLIGAIARLDYPPAKLDVILILETSDAATQAALRQLELPPFVRALLVPQVGPRTKPKALNYAMQFVRGEFVVVYDAEDEPDPGQLRRALAAFAAGPRDLACIQARLNIYNAGSALIARQFTLEYCALFDALLPALARMRLPVLLGGTSNHFPRHVLERLLLWDAHNVTEDADLGIRLARAGWRVDVISSTTYEEAPTRIPVWIRQRTRWLKGFIQTWLVHMRRPHRLLRDLGTVGFIGFHAYLGGVVVSALLHPLFMLLVALAIADGNLFRNQPSWVGTTIVSVALFNLAAGYLSGMALCAIAALRRGMPGTALHVLLIPVYWLLISFAAWRALMQLWRDPYLWEKTPHTSRRRTHGPPGMARRSYTGRTEA
ncbi:MAG: glycosyltransferase [Hyphomicrobiaceae bacterium]